MAISSLEPPPSPPRSPPPNYATTASQEDKTTLMNTQTNSSPTTDDDEHDQLHEPNPNQQNSPKSSKRYTLLLTINCAVLIVGSVAATLITKFYFIHHGSSRWVSTWVQTAGFPLLLSPILLLRGCRPFSGFTPRLTLLSLVVGVFLGVSNLLFSWGTSYLPVSTSSLLLSSQLAFNLILSAAIAKQKVTFSNLNCVILLTLSSILLALSSSSDRPAALTRRRYLIGFFSTLGAGISFAVYLPVMEVIYREVRCYAMVVEMQLLMGLSATAFATAGMAADGGFTDLKSESAVEFDRGAAAYWWTIWGAAVAWQMSFLGTAGMVFLTTSLTGGVCMTALLAVNVAGGVVVYGDEFGGVKAVATVLCVWGFCSYLYGIYAKRKEQNRRGRSVEMNEIMV